MARILIIDDEVEVLSALSRILEREGYEVESTVDTEDLSDRFAVQPIDVVIADIFLPGSTGLDILHLVNRLGQNTKVVLITGSPDVNTAAEAVRAGAFDYLSKPVSRDRLVSVIKRALEIKALEDENRRYREDLESLVECQKRNLVTSERRFRAFFDNSPAGMAILNYDQRFSTVNRALAEVLNRQGEALSGTALTDLAPEAEKRIRESILALQSGSKESVSLELVGLLDSQVYDLTYLTLTLFSLGDESAATDGWGCVVLDLTERRKAEQNLERSLKHTNRLLEEVTAALAAAVEARDPYTAGHQRRVAELSSAIADVMSLSESKREGLRMASLVHDLGKLSIPISILTKPTRLTKAEYDLIKEHSNIGYHILKEIAFPWPVARIVQQHHERIDGSGYPDGLVGEDILMESRILGAADVVEAMATNRPYRMSLGVDKALDEMEEGRGLRYDSLVVDAVLMLFKERGYLLDGY